jgi:ATP-binding cassette subfamily B protein
LLTAIGTIGYYVAYAYIAWRTVKGDFSIGDLTFLAGFVPPPAQPARIAAERLLAGGGAGALPRRPVLVLRDRAGDRRDRKTRSRFPSRSREGFVFEDVGFRYPGAERWAVRHLELHLRAGEVLALVGENGAGKTTLVKLLTRLYDPDEGRILLDGRDLRDYDLDELRASMGRDLPGFRALQPDRRRQYRGRPHRGARRPRAHRCAPPAQPGRRGDRPLPKGYDQMIGKRFKNGVDLSGGEWQKIAIARAYMREAEVLILDEPTAALDARAEFEVFQRFKELSRGKTAVLISHRFSSVRMADRILVLADGTGRSQGTHEELLAAGGRYAELFELQAAGYR